MLKSSFWEHTLLAGRGWVPRTVGGHPGLRRSRGHSLWAVMTAFGAEGRRPA